MLFANKLYITMNGCNVNNMYQVIREQIRPNLDVRFFSITMCDPEVAEYWNTNIIGTGKQISNVHTLSDDGLTLTSVMLYRSRDDWHSMTSDEYLNDTLFVAQNSYNKTNNITRIFKSAMEI